MKNRKSLSTEFIQLEKSVDQAWKEFNSLTKNTYEDALQKERNSYRKRKEELEEQLNTLERKYDNTVFKLKTKLEEDTKNQVSTLKPAVDRQEEILRQYKLIAIKNDSDNKIGWMDESEIKKAVHREVLNLAYCDIVTFITENRKKVNKFDLKVLVCPFSWVFKKLLEDEKILNWQRTLVNKSFPSIWAAKEYIDKNHKKLIAPFGAYHDNIVDEIAKIDFSLYEEFDFRMLAYNYARREIVKLTSDTCVVEESDFGIHITISLNHSACKQEDNKLIFSVNVQKVKEGYDEKYVSGKELEERLNKKLSEVIKSILESSHPLFLNSSQYEVHFVEDKYKILAD